MASLKDVAQLAGVSMMTVSRVINNAPRVTPATRQRVEEAIKQLHYVPDLSAQKIRGQANKPRTLAVLAEDTATTPFSVDLLLAIEQTAQRLGWDSYIINVSAADDRQRAVRELLAHRPDGIIYTTMGLRKIQLPEALHGLPVVLANCVSDDPHLASYIPDDYQAQYDATHYLLARGYQRPLCYWLPEHELAPTARRLGFEHAWRDAGKSLGQVTQLHMPKGDEGYLALASVLATHITPPSLAYDVVVCGNDRAAFVAYQQLLTMGIKIPHEMAVIGFDNLVGVGHLFLPGLTTLQLPHYQIGEQAARHLIEQWDKPGVHRLACPLLERQSIADRSGQ
ncbi:LacI family DNA-binding transcriptional regulator [Tatumella sp. OPLPL6]|uniref:LacI family DNA-binding transcriptional regulator n=1 Tax=Tatumella sp. OPLPL6 TaxID=1928657 RepID=UPI000C1A5D6E|nr:LacI family DNA-binding transcriptional regulator [Tatumella sp. OPLPL6]PIJ41481.1 transcriptional regulator [Tatumella sp. OPLPL6]